MPRVERSPGRSGNSPHAAVGGRYFPANLRQPFGGPEAGLPVWAVQDPAVGTVRPACAQPPGGGTRSLPIREGPCGGMCVPRASRWRPTRLSRTSRPGVRSRGPGESRRVSGEGAPGALTTGFQGHPGSGIPPAVGPERVTCCRWALLAVARGAGSRREVLSMVLKGARWPAFADSPRALSALGNWTRSTHRSRAGSQ